MNLEKNIEKGLGGVSEDTEVASCLRRVVTDL